MGTIWVTRITIHTEPIQNPKGNKIHYQYHMFNELITNFLAIWVNQAKDHQTGNPRRLF
jgi:hypothetical protein